VPEAGERGPDFALPSTDGEVRLGELLSRGRVLLAFYFEDATPTCSTEVEALKDAYEALRELGAEVVAISADGLESHRAFADRLGGLPFPLASDEDVAVARAYDAVADGDPRRSRRALFAIDRDGTVLYVANPYSPNSLSQLEGALRALGVEV